MWLALSRFSLLGCSSLFAFKQCHVLKIKSVTRIFRIEANDESGEQFNVLKSGAPNEHVGNRKRLVNCNDRRFIFNIINIYTFCVLFFICVAFWLLEQLIRCLINSKARRGFSALAVHAIFHVVRKQIATTKCSNAIRWLSFRMHMYDLAV